MSRFRLTQPMTRLRQLISLSPAFHTMIGATGNDVQKQATAFSRIYRVSAKSPVAKRPCVIILPPDSIETVYDTADQYSPLLSRVVVPVIIESVATPEQVAASAASGQDWELYQPFADAADAVIEDVERLAQTSANGWWQPISVTLGYAPERVQDRDSDSNIQGEFLSVAYDITMGVAGE